MKTKVIQTKKMGRGVVANKAFLKGDIIEASPCLTWNQDSEKLIHKTDLDFYVFNDDNSGSVLALGVGSLFNHSAKDNATYKYNKETNELIFMATKKIKKGQQIFIDYGYDPVVEAARKSRYLRKHPSTDALPTDEKPIIKSDFRVVDVFQEALPEELKKESLINVPVIIAVLLITIGIYLGILGFYAN